VRGPGAGRDAARRQTRVVGVEGVGRRGAVHRPLGRAVRLRPRPGGPHDVRAGRLDAGRTPRLICLFGCGGDRDRGKRPLMGAAAEQLADVVVITSDNPRTENPDRILDEIESGMTRPHERIEDREAAIVRALEIARPDDLVLLAGKGHETYQVRGETRYPCDERAIVLRIIASRV